MADLRSIRKGSSQDYENILVNDCGLLDTSNSIYLLSDDPMRETLLWRASTQGLLQPGVYYFDQDSSNYKYFIICYTYTYGTNAYGMRVYKAINPYYHGIESSSTRKRYIYVQYTTGSSIVWRFLRFENSSKVYISTGYFGTPGSSSTSSDAGSCAIWEIWGTNNL